MWERDESPNQIRKQTWVEKGQLAPDGLNFPESHHCLPESPQHTHQLSVHGHSELPTGKSESEHSDLYGIHKFYVTALAQSK